MKKTGIIISSLSVLLMCSCEKESKKEISSAEDLEMYVDSIKKTAEPDKETFKQIESEYQEKLSRAEVLANSDEEKRKIEESKKEFTEFRTGISANSVDAEQAVNSPSTNTGNGPAAPLTSERKKEIRDALFGQGKVGNDIGFEWVTSQNILKVYEGFVNAVKANKEYYSREDWDEVKVLYEALDTRKNEVEKNLASKDNMQIAKLKVEFASYETLERPLSKVKENQNAKN